MTDEIEDMFDDLSKDANLQDDYDPELEDAANEEADDDGYWDEPAAVHQRHTCRSCTHYGTTGLQAYCDEKQDEIYDICDTCESWGPRY